MKTEQKPKHNAFDNIYEIRKNPGFRARFGDFLREVERLNPKRFVNEAKRTTLTYYYYLTPEAWVRSLISRRVSLPVWKILVPDSPEASIGAIYYIFKDSKGVAHVYRGTYGYGGKAIREHTATKSRTVVCHTETPKKLESKEDVGLRRIQRKLEKVGESMKISYEELGDLLAEREKAATIGENVQERRSNTLSEKYSLSSGLLKSTIVAAFQTNFSGISSPPTKTRGCSSTLQQDGELIQVRSRRSVSLLKLYGCASSFSSCLHYLMDVTIWWSRRQTPLGFQPQLCGLITVCSLSPPTGPHESALIEEFLSKTGYTLELRGGDYLLNILAWRSDEVEEK